VKNPRDVPLDPESSVRITVQTDPAGCLVFADLVPIRNEKDGLALTPCEFVVPSGLHTISVERPGGKRSTVQLDFSSDRTLEFDVSGSPGEVDDPSLLNAPLFEAAIGRPIPLTTLNSPDGETDPFLTPDGLTIYFASDRGGERAVYTARRLSPYHDFGPPEVIPATSGSDQPVSPSTSADGLVLTYGVAGKPRIWQVIRTSIESPFGNKEIIRTDENGERDWPSAQISADGLRLYWCEENRPLVTRATVRASKEKLFGKTLEFSLPGGHPHLSADGLRQFALVDRRLMRARRGSVRDPFGALEPIQEEPIEGVEFTPERRQFWLTEDEQWLFVSDPSQQSGDLFVIRLADGPVWGRAIVGRPVANTMTVAAAPMPEPSPEPATTVDQNSQAKPLPYTEHWTQFRELMESGNAQGALALTQDALKKADMAPFKELLTWDQADAEALQGFQQQFQAGLEALKLGDPIRIGGTRFEFQRLEGDTVHVKLKEKDLTRTREAFSPGEKISVAEAADVEDTPARALQIAVALHFEGDLYRSLADGWFKKAGDLGIQFHERLARRNLAQARAELARGKIAPGIEFLQTVIAMAPGTRFAEEAQAENARVYEALVWNPVGPRVWKRGAQGEFSADSTRSNDSYVASEAVYRNFELTCEWKAAAPNAMGGIYFRYDGTGKPLDNGAKIQLAGDSALRRMDRFATGALFAVTSPSQNASRMEGEWNSLRMRVVGTTVQVWINDKQVLETTLAETIPESGKILLDGVSGGLSYRKILVFELDAAAPFTSELENPIDGLRCDI